jgi:plastocyanin
MRAEPILLFLLAAGVALASDDSPAARPAPCCEGHADAAPRRNDFLLRPVPGEDEVTGAAHGRIVFKGELPEVEPLRISEAQAAGCTAEGEELDRRDLRLLIGEDRGIANAVVTIEVEGDELRVPEEPVVLDQVQCRFDQHVLLVPVGCTLEYRNSDQVPHNVHTFSLRNKAFNTTLAAGGKKEQVVEHAETIQIRCDIHPWMSAYVFASGTSHAALTDAHGAFRIEGLPPGEYEARIWHEALGKATAKVVVAADGSSEALEVELEQKQRRRRRR